jgi:hypothetical protein
MMQHTISHLTMMSHHHILCHTYEVWEVAVRAEVGSVQSLEVQAVKAMGGVGAGGEGAGREVGEVAGRAEHRPGTREAGEGEGMGRMHSRRGSGGTALAVSGRLRVCNGGMQVKQCVGQMPGGQGASQIRQCMPLRC